jgi:hypothetical protein
MLHYWITIPAMKKCKIPFTSWVTRIANGLGLSDNVILTFIPTPRSIIGFDFFAHTHLLIKKGNKYIMIYKGYTNEYPLPNRNLGLYSVESFVLPLQKEGLVLGRGPSARITRNQQPQYRGADAAPAGSAFTHFVDFEQAGPSQPSTQPLSHHSGWREQPIHEHGEFSSGAPWGPGNFSTYHSYPQ